jgi:hypothetical protein
MQSRAFTSVLTVVLSTLAILTAVTVPARAQSGPWQLEAVGGRFDSDLMLNEDPAYGLRLVRDTGARWSFEGQVVRLSGDDERDFAIIAIFPPPPNAIEHIRFEYDALAVDLSVRLRLLPEDSPVRLHLLAGPGWGFVDGEVLVRFSSGIEELTRRGGALDDSFTAHAGLALSFDFAERWYLRFDGRARTWNERSSNDTDAEYTLGLGFRL